MKKTISLLFLILFVASASDLFADNTGCGLGTMLFKGKKGKIFEILAVTTNGTSANQTFAITSGTMEYRNGATIAMNDMNQFVAKNMDYLAIDIARGNGEYLDTLVKIMKVSERDAFKAKLKNNFSKIYTSEKITSKEVVANINKVYNS